MIKNEFTSALSEGCASFCNGVTLAEWIPGVFAIRTTGKTIGMLQIDCKQVITKVSLAEDATKYFAENAIKNAERIIGTTISLPTELQFKSELAYAGIGSRQTPAVWLETFRDLGEILDTGFGAILRSGGAAGADTAFEQGADRVFGAKQIFLPWRGFNDSKSELYTINSLAFRIAEFYHPYWGNLSQGGQKLQARNSYQVLGADLRTPAKCVICWTKNGSGSGGTGQAIRLANSLDIPVFDAGRFSDCEEFKKTVLDYFNNLVV